ncbi:hypothetical protein A3Q56_01089 [Intoshia linei]|uniref:Protein kinase domain-containing protein n=1 Tax=Intoshia linei TaxID=1819745 RepID=A0A177BBW6_9BILA|nr:hypothetical protein A3Q56_01089 [Intoshia linei]
MRLVTFIKKRKKNRANILMQPKPIDRNLDYAYQELNEVINLLPIDDISKLIDVNTFEENSNILYSKGGEWSSVIKDKGFLPINIISVEELSLDVMLGEGAFAEVYQGQYANEKVAIKSIYFPPEDEEIRKDCLFEILILRQLVHENIIKQLAIAFIKTGIYIVLEFMNMGNLLTFLRTSRPLCSTSFTKWRKPFRQQKLTRFSRNFKLFLKVSLEVSCGCKYLESKSFSHRDIASRNILLNVDRSGNIISKISDFGLSRELYKSQYYIMSMKKRFPVRWMPPEVLSDGYGKLPYGGFHNSEILSFLNEGGRLTIPTNCPSELYALMKCCWSDNTEKRPSFAHIYIKMIKFSKTSQKKSWIFRDNIALKELRQKNYFTNFNNLKEKITVQEIENVILHFVSLMKEYFTLFKQEIQNRCLFTAITLFKRFYLYSSPFKYPLREIMITCAFMAMKIGEFSIPIQSICSKVQHVIEFSNIYMSHSNAKLKGVEEYSKIILYFEQIVLDVVKYHITIYQPFRLRSGLLQYVKFAMSDLHFSLDVKQIIKESDNFIHKSLYTDVHFIYNPCLIALSALIYASNDFVEFIQKHDAEFDGNISDIKGNILNKSTPKLMWYFLYMEIIKTVDEEDDVKYSECNYHKTIGQYISPKYTPFTKEFNEIMDKLNLNEEIESDFL